MPAQTANERFMLSDDRIDDDRAPTTSVAEAIYTSRRLPQHRTRAAVMATSGRLGQQISHRNHGQDLAGPLECVLFFHGLQLLCIKRSHSTDSSRRDTVVLLAQSDNYTGH